MVYNGPLAGLVAVGACPERSEGSGLHEFLHSPAKRTESKCHDKTIKVARKNCDKFITPTIHVSICGYFKTVPIKRMCNDN